MFLCLALQASVHGISFLEIEENRVVEKYNWAEDVWSFPLNYCLRISYFLDNSPQQMKSVDQISFVSIQKNLFSIHKFGQSSSHFVFKYSYFVSIQNFVIVVYKKHHNFVYWWYIFLYRHKLQLKRASFVKISYKLYIGVRFFCIDTIFKK